MNIRPYLITHCIKSLTNLVRRHTKIPTILSDSSIDDCQMSVAVNDHDQVHHLDMVSLRMALVSKHIIYQMPDI